MIFRKIEQDNCFLTQLIVNEKYFTPKNSYAALCTTLDNLGNVRISRKIGYVRTMDDKDFLTIFGHRDFTRRPILQHVVCLVQ